MLQGFDFSISINSAYFLTMHICELIRFLLFCFCFLPCICVCKTLTLLQFNERVTVPYIVAFHNWLHISVWHHLPWKMVCSDTLGGSPAFTYFTELCRYMGATLQQEFCDCVIICSEFKPRGGHGKTNKVSFMFRLWMYMLCDFTRYGDFWHATV